MRILPIACLALALAACQPVSLTASAPPELQRQVLHADGEGGDDPHDHTPLPISNDTWNLPLSGPAGEKLVPTSAMASTHHGCMAPGNAIDGDTDSAWANADIQEGEAWMTLTFPTEKTFRGIRIKTDPTAHGVTFKVMTSNDGVRWEPASGRLVNLSWGMEPQEVAGQGRILKLEFFNHMVKPTHRFTVFELEAYGGAATPGVPFPWITD